MEELTYGELVEGYKRLVYAEGLLDPYSEDDARIRNAVRQIIDTATSTALSESGRRVKRKVNTSEEVTMQAALVIEAEIDQLMLVKLKERPISEGVQMFIFGIQNLVRGAMGHPTAHVMQNMTLN